MTWNVQYGNDDEFKATILQATLNALAPGTYGFTAYCQRAGEEKKWKVDEYSINVAGDDDQGDGLITVIPTADSSPEPAGGVFVHLFEWPWADIEKECTYLAAEGLHGRAGLAAQRAPGAHGRHGRRWPTTTPGGCATSR